MILYARVRKGLSPASGPTRRHSHLEHRQAAQLGEVHAAARPVVGQRLPRRVPALAELWVRLGMNPIVTLGKQLLNMIGNLV